MSCQRFYRTGTYHCVYIRKSCQKSFISIILETTEFQSTYVHPKKYTIYLGSLQYKVTILTQLSKILIEQDL